MPRGPAHHGGEGHPGRGAPPGTRLAGAGSWDELAPAWARSDTGPLHHDPEHREWRSVRALHRWQDAVRAWATEAGVPDEQLRARGWWPTRPPRFDDGG